MKPKGKKPWSGSGSKDDPYQIASEKDLQALANQVKIGKPYKGSYFILENDVELTKKWTGIGTGQCSFNGTFDGNSHKISGITLGSSTECGFFRCTGTSATVRNLSLEGSAQIVKGISFCGLVAGMNNGTVSGCNAVLYADVEAIEKLCYVGLLVGTNQKNAKISDCKGTLEMNCGMLTATEGEKLAVGGVAGKNQGTAEQCAVTCTGDFSSANKDLLCAAGLAGENAKGAILENSSAEVRWQTADEIYGTVKENKGSISGCSGTVYLTLTDKAAKVAGTSELYAAYSLADVKKIQQNVKGEKNMPGSSKVVSTTLKLGGPGETHTLSYENIILTEEGCLEIYGNLSLEIGTLENRKTEDTVPYEIRVNGEDGENGKDSEYGEDGGDGTAGKETEVSIHIKELQSSIRLIAAGGKGGDGGNGLDGKNGGDGGDAAFTGLMARTEMGEEDACTPSGGKGGDGSDGRGKGGNGGDGGPTPKVSVSCGRKDSSIEVQTKLLPGEGGKPGCGGKGGKGGRGGKNGDGKKRAKPGREGKSYDDGKEGQSRVADAGAVEISYTEIGEEDDGLRNV